jgi:hypothetical protein
LVLDFITFAISDRHSSEQGIGKTLQRNAQTKSASTVQFYLLLHCFLSANLKNDLQTILMQSEAAQFLHSLPISRFRSLGGKLGAQIEAKLGCQTCGEVQALSESELASKLGKSDLAAWLFGICRGICDQPGVL